MNRPSYRLSAALLAAIALGACGDSTGPDTNRVQSVRISPADPTIVIGEEVQLEATALNGSGQAISGKSAAWSSANPDVASVTPNGGLVEGVSGGATEITATIEGKSASVTVTVHDGAPPDVSSVSPETLLVGATATLNGSGFTSGTRVMVNGVRAVVTSSSDTEIRFTVPCVAPGPASVTAQNGTATSTSLPVTAQAEPSGAFALGEMRIFAGAACLQLPATSSSETYLVGVQSTSENPAALSPAVWGIDVSNGTTADVPLSLYESPRTIQSSSAEQITDASVARWAKHRQTELKLRERERPFIYHRRGGAASVAMGIQTAAAPVVGDTLTIKYPDVTQANFCSANFTNVKGIVRHVSQRGVFLEDVGNPSGGFTSSDLQQIGTMLDQYIYATDVAYFGQPLDQDANGRIVIFITKEVNKQDGILGFVVSTDFNPTCASWNAAEIYYGRAPDPQGEHGASYSVEDARRDMPPLIAHELAHIIQFSRAQVNPAIWTMESQGTLAEEVVGHTVTGRQPGQNYDFNVAFSGCISGTSGIRWYCDGFFDLATYYGWDGSRGARIPGAPEECSWLGRERDGNDGPCPPTRMVYTGWGFLRWLSDQFGPGIGGEQLFHRRLVDATSSGFAAISGALGVPIDTLLAQYAASLYIDDRFAGMPDRLQLLSWDLRSVEGLLASPQNYPAARLEPVETGFTNFVRTFAVRGGSSAYFLVKGQRSATAIRATSPSGAALPANMQMWVVRVQ